MKFQPADRIAGFKAYYFATLAEKISEMKKQGKNVIRLDIGSPDLPPTHEIIEKLCQSAHQETTHGYTLHSGTSEFRKAIARFYRSRFGVPLDFEAEILSLIGSKEGLFHLCQAFLNPDDLVIVPSPGYPVYSSAVEIAGAKPYILVLKPEDNYLPDFNEIPPQIAEQAKMMWLNYPNNPTGAVATLDFFKRAVNFAQKNHILLVHDAPYTEVCYEGFQAPSILEVPGAKETAVEFNSLSKTYNMAGWRVGYACGNQEIIKALRTYKSQLDSANFRPILDAATFALDADQKWLQERNKIYTERRDIIVKSLHEIDIDVSAPKASLYVWTKIPHQFDSGLAFCQQCLSEINVSIAPGELYGIGNDRYMRISLACATHQINEAMLRLTRWLK